MRFARPNENSESIEMNEISKQSKEFYNDEIKRTNVENNWRVSYI